MSKKFYIYAMTWNDVSKDMSTALCIRTYYKKICVNVTWLISEINRNQKSRLKEIIN